jgi:regulator of RNase E activity RraA
VLVVDGGGSLRRALVGGNVATSAAQNGWAGVLVYGCVRDVAELKSTPVGLYALALNPMPTVKQGQGLRDVYVQIAGVFAPGDWLYADADGIIAEPPQSAFLMRVAINFDSLISNDRARLQSQRWSALCRRPAIACC